MYLWNVDKLHTNTQYLLGELGRDKLVRGSEIQGCTKRLQGNIKPNPLCMKPTPVLQYNTVSLSLCICNDSTSKFINELLISSLYFCIVLCS